MKTLNEIQKKLKCQKNQFNKFGNYNYRNQEDILEAVKPLLGESILTISDEIIEVGGRIYVKATATLMEGSTSISVTSFAREPETQKGMSESQVTGASSSYARKYALNGLFALDDTKDSDATNTHGKDEAKQDKAFTLSANEMGDLARQLKECTELDHLTEYWIAMDSNWKELPIVKELFSKRKQELTK